MYERDIVSGFSGLIIGFIISVASRLEFPWSVVAVLLTGFMTGIVSAILPHERTESSPHRQHPYVYRSRGF